MLRKKGTYNIAKEQVQEIKYKMLNWSKQFGIFLYLDSNDYTNQYSRYECMLGVSDSKLTINSWDELVNHTTQNKDWVLGHIAYDHKNNLESKLSSQHPAGIGFQDLSFFVPEVVCYIASGDTQLQIESASLPPDKVFNAIKAVECKDVALPQLTFALRDTKETYLSKINTLRGHIKKGDCYEINYCVEGYAENAEINTLSVFNQLNSFSKAPFAAYYRLDDKYMMSASPERYLYKRGDQVMSQPIKGTIKRGADKEEDVALVQQLKNSTKDKAENVMITDLVRNDLARSCKTGSIKVDELFGIYTFPQVHQMISTVSGTLEDSDNYLDSIKYSFPMGSMTGAPKVKVMELIEQYEEAKRELFSGTVGYINPDGDFDFNVIIRSLFYNQSSKYLSYQAGGAITYDSDAEEEWNEMRLKAWALEKIFSKD